MDADHSACCMLHVSGRQGPRLATFHGHPRYHLASRKTDRLHLITGGILGTLRDLRKYLAGLGVDDGYKACSSRYDGVQETEA